MVFDFFRKSAQPGTEIKASAAGPVIAMQGGMSGRVAWSPRDVVSLTKAGFTGCGAAF